MSLLTRLIGTDFMDLLRTDSFSALRVSIKVPSVLSPSVFLVGASTCEIQAVDSRDFRFPLKSGREGKQLNANKSEPVQLQ